MKKEDIDKILTHARGLKYKKGFIIEKDGMINCSGFVGLFFPEFTKINEVTKVKNPEGSEIILSNVVLEEIDRPEFGIILMGTQRAFFHSGVIIGNNVFHMDEKNGLICENINRVKMVFNVKFYKVKKECKNV